MKLNTLLLTLLLCVPVFSYGQQEALNKAIKAMTMENDPDANVTTMQRLIKDYHLDSVQHAEEIDVLKGIVALGYLKTGAFSKFDEYIGEIRNKFNQTSYMDMAVAALIHDKVHLEQAEKIAASTIRLYESYRRDTSARPTGFPAESWNSFMKRAAGIYYQSYADILFLNGKKKLSLTYQEMAVAEFGLDELPPNTQAQYASLLDTDGQYEKAYDLLYKIASRGKADEAMLQQLKQLSLKKGNTQAQANELIGTLQQQALANYRLEVRKKMMKDVTAPAFNLSDVNGKRMSLESLRGKVVVIDFWATWCAPCLASIPAMKQLVKQHPEVVFLFIATKDTPEKVKAFVRRQQWDLQVLLDTDTFEVAKAYGVEGIPTKIVIDKQGNQRFVTSGYSSDGELINEMKAMITLADAQ